jgi:hypothetical protein
MSTSGELVSFLTACTTGLIRPALSNALTRNAFREIAPSVRGRLTAFNEPGNTMERTLMTPAARPFFIV